MAEEYITSIIGDNPEREADALIAKLQQVLELQSQIDRNAKSASSSGGNTNLQSAVTATGQLVTLTNQANASLSEQSRLWKQTTDLIAQQNGHSKEFATVQAKLAVAMKEEARAATEAARAETEASKQRLNNARAYATELKNQQAEYVRVAQAKIAADKEWLQFKKQALADAAAAEKARQAESLASNKAYVAQYEALLNEAEAKHQRGLQPFGSRNDSYPYAPSVSYASDPVAEGRAAVAQVQAQANRDLDAVLQKVTASTDANTEATQRNVAVQAELPVLTSVEVEKLKQQGIVLRDGTYRLAENTTATESNATANLSAAAAETTHMAKLSQLRAQLIQMRLAGLQGTDQYKALAKEALNLATIQQKVNTETQAGIGIFKGASSGIKGIWSSVRQLAYILPGIGIAGIFALALEPIQKLWEKVVDATNAVIKLSKAEQDAARIQDAISASYGTNAAKLLELKTRIEDVNTPMAKRLAAIDELKKMLPDYFGKLSNEEILAGNVANAYERATKAILASARVRTFTDELGKLVGELDKIQTRIENNKGSAELDINPYTGQYGAPIIPGMAGVPSYKTGEKDKNGKPIMSDLIHDTQTYNALLLKQNELLGKIKDNEKDATAAQPAAGGVTTRTPIPNARTPIPNDYYQQDISAQRKAIEEKSRMRQADLKEDEADFKRIADDENESLDVRLAAYRVYLNDKKALIEEEKNAQIAAARNTISELEKEQARNNSLIGGGKLNATQKESLQEKNKAITEQIKALNAEILRLDRERTTEQRTIEQDGAKGIEQIRESSIRKQIQTVADGLVDIANETSDHYRKQKDDLQAQYDDRVITYQQYKTAIGKIDAKENNETLDKQKKFAKDALEQLLKEADVPPEVIRAIKAKIDALYDKPQRDDSNRGVLNLTDEQRQQLTLAETYVDVAINSQKVITAFYEAASQKRIDAIDAEIDKIKERAQAEIDAVQNSAAYAMLSEQEKKEKISEINAIARQKEKDLERDKIAEMRRRAIYEKAITIASIIAKTALAVLVQLSTGDGYTAFARALAAGATGAAELATAIAAPLPQYRLGKEDTGKAHFAVVGDGDKKEVVETKDGTYITPDKPMVTFLPAHSRVYPSVDDYIARAHDYTFKGMGMLKRLDEREGLSTKEMESLLRRVANATEALQGKNPVVIKQDWSQSYYLKVKK